MSNQNGGAGMIFVVSASSYCHLLSECFFEAFIFIKYKQ
jgi:hypothetical protein